MIEHPTPAQARTLRRYYRETEAMVDRATRDPLTRLCDLIEAREKAFHVMRLAQAHTPYDVDYADRREADYLEARKATVEAMVELARGARD